MKNILLFFLILSAPTVFGANVYQTIRESGGDHASMTSVITLDTTISDGDTAFFTADQSWTKLDSILGTMNFGGWGTTGTVIIRTSGGGRHGGVYDETAYGLFKIISNAQIIDYEQDTLNVIFDGIQFKDTSTATGEQQSILELSLLPAGSRATFQNCIFQHTVHILWLAQDGSTDRPLFKFINNLFYQETQVDRGGLLIVESNEGSVNFEMYNNTIRDFDAIYNPSASSHSFRFKNNLISDLTSDIFDMGIDTLVSTTHVFDVAYNSWGDSVSFAPNNRWGPTNYRNQTYTFEDAGNDNFLLSSSDVGAKDLGIEVPFMTQIRDNTDDAEFYNNSFTTTTTVQIIGNNGPELGDGYYMYQDVPIIKDATISETVIIFVTQTAESTTDWLTLIYGEDTASSTTYASASDTLRNRTSANVAWDNESSTAGGVFTSPDLSSVTQEQVDRTDWVYGANVGYFWLNNSSTSGEKKRVWARNGSVGLMSTLKITFEGGLVTTDVNDVSRPQGSANDIGFSEVVVAVGGDQSPRRRKVLKGDI